MSRNALTVWYARQTARDQRVLVIGGAVVVIGLLLWAAWLPQSALGKTHTKIDDQQQLLAYMRQVGPTLAAAGPGGDLQPIGESFVVFVDRTAREHGLGEALTGSPPTGSGSYRVTFEGADFNLMLTWVHQVSTRYGVRVETASVTGNGTPGKVNASVQLRPPA